MIIFPLLIHLLVCSFLSLERHFLSLSCQIKRKILPISFSPYKSSCFSESDPKLAELTGSWSHSLTLKHHGNSARCPHSAFQSFLLHTGDQEKYKRKSVQGQKGKLGTHACYLSCSALSAVSILIRNVHPTPASVLKAWSLVCGTILNLWSL